MPTTNFPRTMTTAQLVQRELPDRHAATTDWDVLGVWQAAPEYPVGADNFYALAYCTADVDTGTVGELRLRSNTGITSAAVPVYSWSRNIRLGGVNVPDGPQTLYVEGRRVSGSGGVRLIEAAVSLVSLPPTSLRGNSTTTGKFATTAQLVNQFLQPGGSVLAWMPNTTTATSKRDNDWELNQFSSFTNADGSPSYGNWYPNTETGGTQYANANYNFVHNTSQAFSGTGYLQQSITGDLYLKSYAAQNWRTVDQAGNNFPHTFYLSTRVRFHETITYDNSFETTPGNFTYGFTNHIQVYRTLPSSAVFVSLGAGHNLQQDAGMRWHVNLDNRVYFDIPRIFDPVIPLNQWIHIEMYLVISDGFDGRSGVLKCWQDGQQWINYSGPTIADYWEKIGISWGNYGHLLGQTTVTMDYDETLVSTVPTIQNLVLPSPAGGNG